MSFTASASGHVPAQAADGTPQDAAALELELYNTLRAVVSNPRYGVTNSSFGGSHVSGSLHLADDGG